MDLQLVGKRVLVTGASKGIGLAIVRAFVAEGASVTAVSRRTTPELEATGAAFVSADLSKADECRRMVEAVLATDPRLDVLVNNAGGGSLPEGSLGNALDGGDDIWQDVFALNLSSSVRVIRAALPALIEARGAIINIGSDTARRPGAAGSTPLPYAAAKAALTTFSRGLAERIASQGVRVNTVSPALTRTNAIAGDDGYLSQVAQAVGVEHATLLQTLPADLGMLTGNMIEPDEIARAVLLLASPTMPSAIGANWAVDAGSIKVA
ncbi:NAD(P)-dependent dehydrogenase (short-subunit alcohol dehydrogenase family) [Streptomyces sp. SAI-133]|uniref:SDR family NAD(P)-dependent oxidoreductase n=1 Tax=Streptomyces sp. SAI-133 TaxID=2940547 RepID=UPI002476497D|nr:SDR family NAD(P)-dependent oxidoreductase [Streptomyces sp. SAI-133]MDH6581525.1 NAD(P)-dependent dehydrogenase (short-subunit alcohol dehydrogenase family) [Streptomyces sp. SAI-133]